MPKVKANGIEMYYEIQGQGEPLIMIMGIGGTTKSWGLQVQEFAKHYQVFIFDNRGSGQTDKPEMKYSIKLFTEDTVNLMAALGIQKANILGLSMGGWIAQQIAIHYPHLVKNLILVCTSDKVYKMGEKIMEVWRTLAQNNDMKTLVKDFLIWTFSTDYFENQQKEIEQLEMLLSGTKQPLYAYLNQLDACLEHNASDSISKISAPTLVIGGEQDILCPPRFSKMLCERIPNAKLTILEGSGHGVIWEVPQKFNKAVLSFLKSN